MFISSINKSINQLVGRHNPYTGRGYVERGGDQQPRVHGHQGSETLCISVADPFHSDMDPDPNTNFFFTFLFNETYIYLKKNIVFFIYEVNIDVH